MSNFLPDGYAPPATQSDYFKPSKSRETRLRIISSQPMMGMVAWNTGDDGRRAPVRRAMGREFEPDEYDANGTPKHFWAVAIYNYTVGRIQVWEITQATIMEQIKDLQATPEYGHPNRYDIIVRTKGQDLNTEYTVIGVPPMRVNPVVIDAWNAVKPTFDLTRLWTGGDPFGREPKRGATPQRAAAPPGPGQSADENYFEQGQPGDPGPSDAGKFAQDDDIPF